MHGANLIKAIRSQDEHASFRFWGGDRMQAQAGKAVKHISDLAFMGFWEVATNLPGILHNIRFCQKDLLAYRPDVLILIDYPGFNLRLARFAHRHGIRVAYYISPQVWAWKKSRIHTIKRVVDKMLVILPFEKEFYSRFGYEVEFPGHPLLDEVAEARAASRYGNFRQDNLLPDKPLVALLPGSRRQEVARMLRPMISAATHFPDHQFVVAGISGLPLEFYTRFSPPPNISVVYDQTYALLDNAEAALVTSGTATLEAALFNVPQVVCYRASPLSYHIARRLVKVKHISLVNLVMDKAVVREIIQSGFGAGALREELNKLLFDQRYRANIQQGYQELREKLGGQGASGRAARMIIQLLAAAG